MRRESGSELRLRAVFGPARTSVPAIRVNACEMQRVLAGISSGSVRLTHYGRSATVPARWQHVTLPGS
jgi:hypothetical protein